MSNVLYRKYRSRTFADIYGQKTTVKILTHSLKTGNISHAYLFTGPRGTGKTSMARLMAKGLNDQKFGQVGDIDPDSKTSQEIETGRYLDLIEIDAASNRGIEEIRQLKDQIRYLPTQGKYKVYIIDEVHMLTREAFNALLKTLEEPPEHVVFILATTEPQKLPATILSRVQRYNFRLANEEELVGKLEYIAKEEGIKIDPEVYSLIYKLSGGSFRDAESFLEKLFTTNNAKLIELKDALSVLGLAEREEVLKFVNYMVNADLNKMILHIRQLHQDGVDLVNFLGELIREIHSRLLTGENLGSTISNLGNLLELQEKIKNYDDTLLLFEIYLCKSFPGQNVNINIAKKATIKSTPKDKGQEAPYEEINNKIDEREEKLRIKIIDHLKNKNKVLWTMLKLSNFELAKNILTVKVRSATIKEQIESNKYYGDLVEFVNKIPGLDKLEIIVEKVDGDQVTENNYSHSTTSLVESNTNKVEDIFKF